MKEYASNPKANFDYEILETIEAGLILKGYEVKAVKTGKAMIKGSYVKIVNGKPQLVGATIAPYQPNNTPTDYDPEATRELLLSKEEVEKLLSLAKSQSTALVPIKLYDKKGLVKLLIGVARGKKKYDKRDTIKKRDQARRTQRGLDE